MNDPFVGWKMLQDQMIAAQKAQLEAATKMLGTAPHLQGALKAAQSVAEANGKAWETWMGLWGVRK
ncbi:hypothetical protein [Sphingomonas solaris]|uniref:Phasin family protein n=1 Tax=Alterirhizorhabdus solaris TaxID=2529389 RepID=A0A558QYE3_9SPHN|nr:hypothetical protein [Sphingomonas solaris]TVV72161.1 hypothetical protein FOY91_15230 [Sphingomonas solaris]